MQIFVIGLLLAFFIGSFVVWKKAKEDYYDENDVFDLIFQALLVAIILGRIVFWLTHGQELSWQWYKLIAIWAYPGENWLGMLVGMVVVFNRYCKRKRWDLFKTLDVSVAGLSLANAILSLSLFISGSGYGRVTKFIMGMTPPGLSEPRWPVGLFGFIFWILMFGYLLWVEAKYRKFEWYQRFRGDAKPGFMFFSFLIGLGFYGALIQLFTEPELVWWGINWEVVLRLWLLLIGALGIYLRSGLNKLDWERWRKSKIKR